MSDLMFRKAVEEAEMAERASNDVVELLRAVDRFALSIDCSARTIDLSFAHQSIDRATTDGSRNNRSIVQQAACAINRIHVNSNALAQSIDSARVQKLGVILNCFAFQCAVSFGI